MFFVLALTGFINLLSFNKIAFTLTLPFIIANVVLCEYYRKSKINFYYKKHVNICRVIAVTLTLIIFGSPTMILFFNRTKPFYHLKQAVYSCGLSNISELRTREFPDFLPKECEDYYFIIKPHAPFPEAPDTFASLSFYTDEETIEKYEREFAGKGYEKANSDKTFEDIMIENEITLSEISEMDSRWLTKTYIKEKGVPQYIVNFTEEEKILDDINSLESKKNLLIEQIRSLMNEIITKHISYKKGVENMFEIQCHFVLVKKCCTKLGINL